jgi:Pregnancy-associated plasma protein-A/Secretion system C-terminal sorting domain
MKKTLLLLTIGCSFGLQAQTVHRCYSREAISYQDNLTPGFAEAVNEQFEIAKQWSQENGPTRSLYTIPVVFHVVYNTPEENIPDSVIMNQLTRLNEDYARMNADTSNMRAEFMPVAGATQIQFILAGIDPQGNPTNGITRTSSATASFGSFAALFGDFTDLEKVKSTADGGHDAWDQTRYLNIWICDMSVGGQAFLLGYATPPVNLPNWPPGSVPGNLGDGVVLQYQCVGSNNPNDLGIANYDVLGRTAVHEVGHYLGLRHIWGDGDCTMDDGVNDTPDATEASAQDCNMNSNTCNADVVGLGDLHDMVENYMDYSAETCQNSFTEQQAALMHGVLENQRYDLVHNNPAGLEELEVNVSCFPNPANEAITIVSDGSMQTVQVIDLNGKTLFKTAVSGNKTTLDLQAFEAGMYTVMIQHSTGMVVQQRIAVVK